MGLTAAAAVRLLFHRIAADRAFPLELKVPDAETRTAMKEAEEIANLGKARFARADALFADLDDAVGR
jgi:DNA-damage-inducible protein J